VVSDLPLFLAKLEAFNVERVGFDRTQKDVRVYLKQHPKEIESECIEYRFPIREGLLDVGYFEPELYPLYSKLFSGKYTVVAYNVKELLHYLDQCGIECKAFFEDVGILKCLSDGLANSDSVDFCLQYHSLPTENRAYGVDRLYEIYYGTLNDREKSLYRDVELPLVSVLFEMEREGVRVNEAILQEFSKKYNEELKNLIKEIHTLAGEEFNVNSTQQLGKVLFDKLGIGAGIKKAKTTKSYKTTAEELEKYVHEHPIIPLILRYRQVQKLNSTYIEGFKPLIKKGKIHTTYSQINTTTGRLSSANPNLQNIPVRNDEGRELRKLFVAGDGNVFLDADYSQIELRLLAHFSNCKELIAAYNEEKDIHAITASQVFNVPLESVSKELRRNAKAVNFGIIYGISAFGLSKDLGISTKQAQQYIDRYFESYSTVKEYMTQNVLSAKETGHTVTLLGRRRVINELKSSNFNVRSFGERAAMNMPLQGSSADIIKLAMLGVARSLKDGGFKAKLLLQVHDELLIDCPIEEQEAVSEILKREMENAVSLSVPLTVEVGIGESWFDAK
ncbi:MAG: DNA polymerase I, partial [Clostridia bacterium]|nr:DNA polymerase I [Clostridia bacterium]